MQCYFRATANWRDKGGDAEHVEKLLDTCCDPWLDWPAVAEYAKKVEAANARPKPGLTGDIAKL